MIGAACRPLETCSCQNKQLPVASSRQRPQPSDQQQEKHTPCRRLALPARSPGSANIFKRLINTLAAAAAATAVDVDVGRESGGEQPRWLARRRFTFFRAHLSSLLQQQLQSALLFAQIQLAPCVFAILARADAARFAANARANSCKTRCCASANWRKRSI